MRYLYYKRAKATCQALSFAFIRFFRVVTDFSSMKSRSAIIRCGVLRIKNSTASSVFSSEKCNSRQRVISSASVAVSVLNGRGAIRALYRGSI